MLIVIIFFFFNDTATTEIYTLSLHDALPISPGCSLRSAPVPCRTAEGRLNAAGRAGPQDGALDGAAGQRCTHPFTLRSEEHTSELQSLAYLVCRLLLEKKKMRILHIMQPPLA